MAETMNDDYMKPHFAHDDPQSRVDERTTELSAANEILKKEIAEHKLAAEELCLVPRNWKPSS